MANVVEKPKKDLAAPLLSYDPEAFAETMVRASESLVIAVSTLAAAETQLQPSIAATRAVNIASQLVQAARKIIGK